MVFFQTEFDALVSMLKRQNIKYDARELTPRYILADDVQFNFDEKNQLTKIVNLRYAPLP
jgi:hypothetical protein